MSEVLSLHTKREGVTLRQLSTPEDDHVYWEAVEANRDHLSQFCDTTSQKYQKPEDVTNARLKATDKIRMGIWDDGTFVGSINATPENDEAEIGYWLDARYVGHGYMTLAVRSLTAYLRPRFQRLFAEVHVDNGGSTRVLERSGYIQVGEVERDWGMASVFEPVEQVQ